MRQPSSPAPSHTPGHVAFSISAGPATALLDAAARDASVVVGYHLWAPVMVDRYDGAYHADPLG